MDYRLNYGNYQPGDSAGMMDAVSDVGGADVAGNAGSLMSKAMPYLQGAGIGLKAIGAVSDIWGMYEQKKQAEKNYQLAKKAFDEQTKRAREQDAIAEEQRQLQNMMTGAEYANNMRDTGRQVYGSYNRMIGR